MKKSLGLRQYMIILFTLFGIALIVTIFPIMRNSVTNMEEELIASRLTADIHYIEDLIGEGDWNLQGDYICRGDVKVGDGKQEHANLDPFLLHEEKTGTFSYVFIRCGDEGLTYVESTPTQAGYQQGHFLRVAGSTKDPNGNSIVGTYMDKKVADILDEYDTYGGAANVAGGMIYCRYDTLKDVDGQVIGAIVVGRSIAELQAQINHTIRRAILAGVAMVILGSILLYLLINRWVRSLRRATTFVQKIETGHIPEERVSEQGPKEINILMQGINSLADTLRENEELRIKSETDQLTGLANRFGLNHHGGELFSACVEKQEPISVGILDIDYFKYYNDNYGHQAGDKCILQVADVLRSLQDEGKLFAARYGGDEFIIVTQGIDQNALERLAEELRERVSAKAIPHAYSEVASVVTVSQGHCVGIPKEGQSLSGFLSIADRVMYEVKNGTKNGYRIRPVMDGAADQEGVAVPELDESEVVEWGTYHDHLTQLLNREGFFRETERILKEQSQEDYCIVRCNIRNFKLANQLFGYEKGNQILIDIAKMLRSDKIKGEVVSRLYGDHFAILLKQSNYDEEKLRAALREVSAKIEHAEYALQFCVGVCDVTDKTLDVYLMCDRANIAMNSIRSGEDVSIVHYDESMMENIMQENVVIAEFEPALQNGEFKVFLQPIVDAQGKVASAEALVRWFRSEDGTMVPPGEFIGILERAGLIYKLDLFVWEEAAKIVAGWKGTSLDEVPVSVNISPRDILYVDLEKTFEELVGKYDIPRSRLNLEFTESALMTNADRYIAILTSLREKGFRVEIDDFGSGYSSLNTLKDIHADVLKIDRGFLQETENREQGRVILASIIDMAKKLSMSVITEGVETETQVGFLSEMGCELFQGFYFSRPIPVEEFEERYQK